jgi:hypothetical protein
MDGHRLGGFIREEDLIGSVDILLQARDAGLPPLGVAQRLQDRLEAVVLQLGFIVTSQLITLGKV